MGCVDISNLDIYTVILALWNNMAPAAFFKNVPWLAPSEPTRGEIDNALTYGYIDYLNGRCIKTDFSDLKKVSTDMYNRDAGANCFENIVMKLSANK